jgi:hypothetical protein
MTAISGTLAWAKEYAGWSSLPQSYSDFVASDVIDFLADVQKGVAGNGQHLAQSPSTAGLTATSATSATSAMNTFVSLSPPKFQ